MTRTGSVHDVLGDGEVFPLIIADPPWVPRAQVHAFPEDPRLAIDGGEDGLARIRECAAAIDGHLGPGGVALAQLAPGDEQADAVVDMTREPRWSAASGGTSSVGRYCASTVQWTGAVRPRRSIGTCVPFCLRTSIPTVLRP